MTSLAPQRFTATLRRTGGRVAVVLPFDPDAAWGAKARHHVTGTVGGCVVRGELERVDGAGDEGGADSGVGRGAADGAGRGGFVLILGPAWRRDNGLDAGAVVEVVVAPEGPLGERLAPDLRAALEAAPAARAFFESLPTFYRHNFVRWVDDAKREATRAARVAEVVRLAGEGRRER